MATRPKFDRVIRIYGSSTLHSVQYDPDASVLDVTLKSGKRYRYRDIWGGAFARLVTSKSPGKVYNELVKKNWGGTERKATKLKTLK